MNHKKLDHLVDFDKINILEQKYLHSDFPLEHPITATVHQTWCGKPLDWDGLASAVAPIVDAFTEVQIIKDDSPQYITDYKMTAERTAHRKDAKITVTLNGRIYFRKADNSVGYPMAGGTGPKKSKTKNNA